MQNRVGIYPGTFDPITNGHLDIIVRSLYVVDKLIIAVAEKSNKQTIFSCGERVEMVKNDVKSFDVSKITVLSFSGLLVNFASEQNSSVIIRGLRAVSDFEYEFQMSCMNSKLNPKIQTIFLPASEKTHFISSRFVKEVASLRGDVTDFVSQLVLEKLTTKFNSKP